MKSYEPENRDEIRVKMMGKTKNNKNQIEKTINAIKR
jgi:hypothetical protein